MLLFAMVLYMLPFYLIAAFTSTSKLRNIYDRGTAAARRTLHTFASQPRLQNVKGTSERQRKEMQDQTNKSTEKVNWIIRPATVDDRDGCAALIQLSYQTLLARDYSDECLAKCLPLITTPREQLLTCNTWFVVEHPSTRQIVGCGGWTVRSPLAKEATKNKVAEKTHSCIDPDAQVPHLRHFATHPGYSRMGIASTIWQKIHSEISKQFLDKGKSFPTIEVFSTLTAEGFYASCGFEVISRFDMTLGKDAVFPVILMQRSPTL